MQRVSCLGCLGRRVRSCHWGAVWAVHGGSHRHPHRTPVGAVPLAGSPAAGRSTRRGAARRGRACGCEHPAVAGGGEQPAGAGASRYTPHIGNWPATSIGPSARAGLTAPPVSGPPIATAANNAKPTARPPAAGGTRSSSATASSQTVIAAQARAEQRGDGDDDGRASSRASSRQGRPFQRAGTAAPRNGTVPAGCRLPTDRT